MHILLVSQYFYPESVGRPQYNLEIAVDLIRKGHQVTVLTAFPNYPQRLIFEGYRGKIFMREEYNHIKIVRTYIYASPDESLKSRALNFGSFCLSAPFGGLKIDPPDVIYAVLPPLPLGLSAWLLGSFKKTPLVVSVEDIYPDVAVALGIIRNPIIIRFFQKMEKFIYQKSKKILVLSEGFKVNLLSKGVPAEKIHVVPSWADPDFIKPGIKDNAFRRELRLGEQFVIIYSGGLSHNSNLEPVIYAADLLRQEPFQFIIVGEGPKKKELERLAAQKNLTNVTFLPFQPWERYGDVLRAADITLVTLNYQTSFASLPSKIYKQMAAGRPILAITTPGNDLDRLVQDARCGLSVAPDDPVALAEALRWAREHPRELDKMGIRARRYLEKFHTRDRCIDQLETVLRSAAAKGHGKNTLAPEHVLG